MKKNTSILLVEDDMNLGFVIQDNLKNERLSGSAMSGWKIRV